MRLARQPALETVILTLVGTCGSDMQTHSLSKKQFPILLGILQNLTEFYSKCPMSNKELSTFNFHSFYIIEHPLLTFHNHSLLSLENLANSK